MVQDRVSETLREMALPNGQFIGDIDTIDRQEVAKPGDVSATTLFVLSLVAAVTAQLLVVGGELYVITYNKVHIKHNDD